METEMLLSPYMNRIGSSNITKHRILMLNVLSVKLMMVLKSYIEIIFVWGAVILGKREIISSLNLGKNSLTYKIPHYNVYNTFWMHFFTIFSCW